MKRTPAVSGVAQSGSCGALASITTILLMATVSLAACTSIQPVADDAEALQQRIRAGQVLQQGDHVRVVTQDGESHKLTVLSVDDDVLNGRLYTEAPVPTPMSEHQAKSPKRQEGSLAEIPIRDIVFVEEEHVSAGKTAATIGGGVIVFLSALLLLSF